MMTFRPKYQLAVVNFFSNFEKGDMGGIQPLATTSSGQSDYESPQPKVG